MLTKRIKLYSKRAFVPTLVIACALTWGLSESTAQEKEVKENYRAFAINMSNLGPNTSTVIDLHITRWSTEEERKMLLNTLIEKGQEEFVKVLRKQEETGWARAQGRAAARTAFPSVRLHYAFEFEQEDMRQIVLITDRPIGMREAASGSRSLDYDVSGVVLEMPKDKDQKGTGKLVVGMKVGYDKEKKKLEIEIGASEPVRLTTVGRVE